MKQSFYSVLGTDYAKDKQLIKKIKSISSAFVGWVDSYDSTNGTVNIQPAIQRENVDENSVADYVNRPFLNNVWLVNNTLTRNPQKGDKALVLVLDEKSNLFFKTAYDSDKTLQEQTFVNSSKSVKTLSNCVAIIVNSNYIQPGETINVIDNLESTSTTDALSANQGRLIKAMIDTKINISGGTFTGLVKFREIDGGCINFDTGVYINKTGGSTAFGSDDTANYVGRPQVQTLIRGSQTRPTYNGNDIALYSDIPTDIPTYTMSNNMSRGSTSAYSYVKINDLLIQWGTTGNVAKESSVTISIQPYASSNFSVVANVDRDDSSGSGVDVVYTTIPSSSSIKLQRDYASSGSSYYINWMTIGKA